MRESTILSRMRCVFVRWQAAARITLFCIGWAVVGMNTTISGSVIGIAIGIALTALTVEMARRASDE